MPELWEVLAKEHSTRGGSLAGSQYGRAEPRAGLLSAPEQPKPKFGTTSSPGYVLDQSGQYVPVNTGLQRLDRASAEQLHRDSAAGFLEDLRTPSSEFVPMNPVQWGVARTGEALQNAPLPMGIGEAAGEAISSGATGRATATGVAEGVLDAVNFVPAAWGVKGAAKVVKGAAKSLARQAPKGARVRAETFSPQRREIIHPDYAGTNPGMTGAESARPQVQGSYWYDTGTQAMPEGSIGVEGHRADLKRVLMPGTAAQKKLRAEAARNVKRRAEADAKRGGYAPAVDQNEVYYEFENLVRERGYYGYAADLPSGRVVKYFNTAEPDQATRRVVNRPTAENIARYMRDNPEGGSIYPNTGTAPASGYAVAQRGGEQVVEGLPSQGTLTSYMDAQAGRMGPNDMVGWWGNEGQTYLDRSRIYGSKPGARVAGELNYQKAGYDVGAGEEIPMTVRPLAESFAAWREKNAAQAGGGMFGQRGAVGDLKPAVPGAEGRQTITGEPDLFGLQGQMPGQARSMKAAMSEEGRPTSLDVGRTVYKGKPLTEWSPKDFQGYGRQYGVPNLGPLTPYKKVAGFDVPGGTEGKFTYYDLMDLKSRGIDPNALPPELHAELQKKLSRTMMPEANNPVQVFNRYLFGLLSPNQPLTPNEFEAIRLFTRSPADIKRLGKFIDWEPGEAVSAARRKAAEAEMVKFFNTNSAGTGGLGLKGTADYTNIAELAKMFEKNPEWFTRRTNEPWENFLERVQSQVRGATSKVGSFATVWQDPAEAGISAIDRHMIKKFREQAFSGKEKMKWEKERVPLWNTAVQKRRDFDKQLKQGAITKAEHQKATKMLPGSNAKKVRKYSDIAGQPNASAWDDSQLMAYITRSKSAKLRLASGEPNKRLPEHLREEQWVSEPDKAIMIGDQYRSALAANRAEAAKHDMGLFESQWMLWDRIRNRLEPHEVMFPGLEKLPPMHQDELRAALKQHSDAGYLSTARHQGSGQRHVRPMPPAGSAYWGVAGSGVLGNEYEKGLTQR